MSGKRGNGCLDLSNVILCGRKRQDVSVESGLERGDEKEEGRDLLVTRCIYYCVTKDFRFV